MADSRVTLHCGSPRVPKTFVRCSKAWGSRPILIVRWIACGVEPAGRRYVIARKEPWRATRRSACVLLKPSGLIPEGCHRRIESLSGCLTCHQKPRPCGFMRGNAVNLIVARSSCNPVSALFKDARRVTLVNHRVAVRGVLHGAEQLAFG
jgi:hypothetical protein